MKDLLLTIVAMLSCIASFAIGPITGATGACAGTTATVANSTAGGTWSSGSMAVATIDAAGTVHAVAAGTTTISYITFTDTATSSFTVVSSLDTIYSSSPVLCMSSPVTLTAQAPSGIWTSSDPSIAAIGMVTTPYSCMATSVMPGTVTISYSLGTGCSVSRLITVEGVPGPITGPSTVCLGSTISFIPVRLCRVRLQAYGLVPIQL